MRGNAGAELGRANGIKLFSHPTTMDKYFADEWLVKWLNKMQSTEYGDWTYLTQNKNVTMDFALRHLEYPWHFDQLSRKPDLTMEIINSMPDKNWDLFQFYKNGKITIENLGENPTKYANGFGLSLNTNLTIDIIKKYPDVEWDWTYVALVGGISMDAIFANYPETIKSIPDCWWYYQKLNISIGTVIANKDSEFLDWKMLSQYEKFTFNVIMQNKDLPWDWDAVGANPSITMEIVLTNPQIGWKDIGLNPNFTMEVVRNYPEYEWDWQDIAGNRNLSMKDIFDHVGVDTMETEAFWEGIVENPNITMDVIFENFDVLSWRDLSLNSGLWLDEVLENENMPWDWKNICMNTFDKSRLCYVDCCYGHVMVMALHEYYEDNCEVEMGMLERVLFDSYLVKMVCKY